MSLISEVRWWGRLLRHIVRRPALVCVGTALVWLTHPWGTGLLVLAVGLIAGLRIWAAAAPDQHLRWTSPVVGRYRLRQVRRCWPELCRRCGLAMDDLPRLGRGQVEWPHLGVVVSPTLGQTVEDFEAVAEALRTGVGASRVRIEPAGVRDVLLTFTVGDQLHQPFDAAPAPTVESMASVTVGRREDGQPWQLSLGPHTLVAGSSGSGKGSVFWSFAFGIAPAVHDGRVQLHGIDLKGGMEVLMGQGLFTTTATNALEAVAVLEQLVTRMQERSSRYAGRQRSHEATAAEPLHVVMIDELAALTAYLSERDLQRRAETAINLLCSQGRAPGFMVFACLQDPRKEVIPSRGLFTQMVGLRLKDLSETTMVLGDVATLSGAHCHRITRDVPGTGYVLPENGAHPVRVRAGFASDDAIRDVSQRFATPTREAVEICELPERPAARRRSRSAEDAA